MLLYALTIFVSAFLLFLLQPIIAKQILPWFGGTAAVWSTCLAFFQLALLAGYFYSDWITRRLRLRQQLWVHIGLIGVALWLLPIVPETSWKPGLNGENEQPSVRILLLLSATVGLPYFLLATTSPLLQAWFAHTHPGKSPYRLFALSNSASMLALLCYPFLIEPHLATRHQAIAWSMGFGVFALLIGLTLRQTVSLAATTTAGDVSLQSAPPTIGIPRAPTFRDKLIWMALAALGSSLLLGVSNQITHNIPSIPLLWVMPLALYLLTFIISFNTKDGAPRWYPRSVSLLLTSLALCAMAWLAARAQMEFRLYLQIGVFSTGLFITCMYCHGELAARKPAPQHLTTFYLMIALGGALGSFLVGIVAPLTLAAYYELGLTVYLLALLATWLLWRHVHWLWMSFAVAVCLFTLGASLNAMYQFRQEVIVMTRNFYGTLRVRETSPDDIDRKRSLVHGGTLHGDQYLDELRKHAATTYYSATSAIGMALLQKQQDLNRPMRVGIVGLGVGTLAAYSNQGDVFRFYEINPDVVTIARREFTYLQDTTATIEIALGDARLNLELEPPQRFDVLAIDAFSRDSIPVHLLTLESVTVYERHMQPDGIIAFHVSNRFLQLHPVVDRIAQERGLNVAWIEEIRDDGSTVSDWILLSKDKDVLLHPDFAAATQPIPQRPEWRLWTDDFNNLLQVLR